MRPSRLFDIFPQDRPKPIVRVGDPKIDATPSVMMPIMSEGGVFVATAIAKATGSSAIEA